MSGDNPTLKDIARALGVSTTTVHRALHGKGGVGDETSQEIKRLAAEMGYRANYMASALKRKNLRLAVVLPEPTRDNRYYYMSLWTGARQFFSRVKEFNVDVKEFYYPLAPGSHGVMLKEVYESHSDGLDGLMTIAVDHSQSSYFLEKLAAKGVPYTLVGADLYRDSRLCCVKAQDETAGSLAAQLLTAFQPLNFEGKLILTGNPVGSFAMLDQYHNLNSFQRYMEAHAPNMPLFTAYDADAGHSCEAICALLEQHPDTYAIYSASARHSVHTALLLRELGLEGRVKLVGNDLFAESEDLLRQGAITAIIDKKIVKQSYQATRLLFNYVVKGEYPPGSTVSVRPAVIMSSHLEAGD